VLKRGGHATMRITFSDEIPDSQRGEVVQRLEVFIGFSERISDRHWAVDVNPEGTWTERAPSSRSLSAMASSSRAP
jgi:hypothetical protein